MRWSILRQLNNNQLLFIVFSENTELGVTQLIILCNLLFFCGQFVFAVVGSSWNSYNNFQKKNIRTVVVLDHLSEDVSPIDSGVEDSQEIKEKLIEKTGIYKRIKCLGLKNVDPKEFQLRLDEAAKHPMTEDDWMNLREVIDEAYGNFTMRIRSCFPKLSESDIRLCHLLMIKLDNEEMTNVLGVLSNAFRTRKTRLRQKLKLKKTSGDLNAFLINF